MKSRGAPKTESESNSHIVVSASEKTGTVDRVDDSLAAAASTVSAVVVKSAEESLATAASSKLVPIDYVDPKAILANRIRDLKKGNKVALLTPLTWQFGSITKKTKDALSVEISMEVDPRMNQVVEVSLMTVIYKIGSDHIIQINKLSTFPAVGSTWSGIVDSLPVRRPKAPIKERTVAYLSTIDEGDSVSDTDEEEVMTKKVTPTNERQIEIIHPDDDELSEIYAVPEGKTDEEVMEEIVTEWSGVKNITEEEEINFLRGHQMNLPVTQPTGAYVKELLEMKEATVPKVAWEGLKQTTHNEHLRYLKTLRDNMPTTHTSAPLATAIIATIEFLKKDRKWKCSTTLKAAASIQGAMSLLPLYKSGASAITLTKDVVWKQAMKSLQRQCKEEKPTQPIAATAEQIRQITEPLFQEGKTATAVALILGWYTASRLGCVIQLEKEDIVCNSDRSLTVTFRRGKGVIARGPYTVHTTQLAEQDFHPMKTYLDSRDKVIFTKATTTDRLRTAIKAVFPHLEQRSLRRGALQAMAAAGVDETTLMRYSGHTRLQTLHRYLNWNSINQKVTKEMQKAGQALVPKH